MPLESTGLRIFGENYSVNIYGGNVFGIGGDYGAGIGSGCCGTMHERQGGYHGQPVQNFLLTEIRITGGEVFAQGFMGAGIGGGRGKDDFDGDPALVYIDGGTVEAKTMDGTPLTSRGPIAIGWGGDYLFSGSGSSGDFLEIYDGAKVLASIDINGDYVLQSAADGRSNYKTYKKIKIEPCDHPNGTNYSNNGNSLNVCNHCYTTEPYTFTTAGNWNDQGNWLGSIMPAEASTAFLMDNSWLRNSLARL